MRAAAALQNPSFMLRRTLLVVLFLTWCFRRCRLSAGFISPHLVCAILGTSMSHNLRACRFCRTYSVRTFGHKMCGLWYRNFTICTQLQLASFPPQFVWASDTVFLRCVLDCTWVRYCHDDFVDLFYWRSAWFQASSRAQLCYPLPECNWKMRTHYSRLGPMMVRCTDADAVWCCLVCGTRARYRAVQLSQQ